jgi:hypothetical protein
MKRILSVVLLSLVARCAAQRDVCWREPYPNIRGEWAGYGSVVEAGARFKTISGATIELWSTTFTYEDAYQRTADHQNVAATLLKTTTSNADGIFSLGDIKPGSYEIRAHMAGRESSSAYIIKGGLPPQWMGRGLRVALSAGGKGCSRLYAAGLDDTDCGLFDCEGLPKGQTRIMFSDGSPLSVSDLFFYRHTRPMRDQPDFTLATDVNGLVDTKAAVGCYDIRIQRGGSMHLCFTQATTKDEVTVFLPPIKKGSREGRSTK